MVNSVVVYSKLSDGFVFKSFSWSCCIGLVASLTLAACHAGSVIGSGTLEKPSSFDMICGNDLYEMVDNIEVISIPFSDRGDVSPFDKYVLYGQRDSSIVDLGDGLIGVSGAKGEFIFSGLSGGCAIFFSASSLRIESIAQRLDSGIGSLTFAEGSSIGSFYSSSTRSSEGLSELLSLGLILAAEYRLENGRNQRFEILIVDQIVAAYDE